ncbi:hypothetical protein B0T26DRAFT_720338 [Lasiosphaeria miniovina]|uniref:Uncharacterized protein n=1 Tax=Lasiosphaeria miniovina TaxID=1954250 RepID=A0AA40A4D6_9PEZI|nr:uncharacterized protein B0T26DRAFT_720338 [Lasiosphaeria miniovina]KAK0709067.1 hypothetical protein B0T26DRAFT_720338 [Lasiosphaeria miniovina]
MGGPKSLLGLTLNTGRREKKLASLCSDQDILRKMGKPYLKQLRRNRYLSGGGW